MRAALLLVMACACAAEISIAPPLIGVARDCAGNTHRVFGVPGAFVVERAPGLRAGRPAEIPAGIKLPSPHAELRRMGSAWLAAWPYAIRLTAAGAGEVYRLPAAGCGGRP